MVTAMYNYGHQRELLFHFGETIGLPGATKLLPFWLSSAYNGVQSCTSWSPGCTLLETIGMQWHTSAYNHVRHGHQNHFTLEIMATTMVAMVTRMLSFFGDKCRQMVSIGVHLCRPWCFQDVHSWKQLQTNDYHDVPSCTPQ